MFGFSVLGSLRVRSGDEVVPVPSRRQRVVLAVLLLNTGRTQPVDRIAAAVWPSEGPKNPENQIAICVHGIRRKFADHGMPESLVRTDPGGYSADVAPDRVDTGRILALTATAAELDRAGLAEEAVRRYRQALALWRGPLLQGLDVPALAPESRWWAEKRVDVVEQLARLELALGRSRDVLPDLTALVAEHPLRENLQRLLITALYHSGRRADALHAYFVAQRDLRAGAGIDPSSELRRLHRDILNDVTPNVLAVA